MRYLSKTLNGQAVPIVVAFLIATAVLLTGCDEGFLEPEPKSFLTPDNVLTKKEGMEGLAVKLNKELRREYLVILQMIMDEYYVSDIAINACPQCLHDLSTQLTPTGDSYSTILQHWSYAYENISDANLLISNIENVTNWSSEQEKKAMLAAGYFHRAYRYYRLVHQYGDVPVYLSAVEQPRLDFNTFSREAILKQIRNDMEFAVQWLPQGAPPGDINRAAGYHLLTKIYLSLRQFQDAVDAASQVIDGSGHALMKDRFGQGPYAGDPRFNVLWDLHQKENKSIAANTEAILVVQDDFGVEGSTRSGGLIQYLMSPKWWDSAVKDPNGFSATTDGPEGNPFADSTGRGDGELRTVDHFNYGLWKEEGTDLRHSEVNWFSLDDFRYNDPESEYYGEKFVREYIGTDTTRVWYPWMYNKVYVPDQEREHRKLGGHTDWYVFRLAGLYLLRAEAYYWLGQMGEAANDINAVRSRAQAEPISPDGITIDYIFDERARELYLEEPRKSELTRVAYIMAQLGNGYSLESMHQDNWYYDRVMRANKYYRENILWGANPYIMKPYHVYWPVPQSEIDANVEGHINQSPGYVGWESNKTPLGYEEIQKLAEKSKYAGQ